MRIAYIFILLFIGFNQGICHEKFHKYEAKVNGISFIIDHRIELFNTVAMLFGHNGMTLSNISYKQETLKYFEPFKNHPVVDSLINSYKLGWGVDDPIFFMLSLDQNLDFNGNLSEDQIKRGGGYERLKLLSGLFKDFCIKSNFYDYFNKVQNTFYNQIIYNTEYNFRSFNVISLLENYYGEKASRYNVVLNLMGGYGNFGKSIIENGEKSIYAVLETPNSISNLPVFEPTIGTFNLIVHEFNHGFVNPITDSNVEKINSYTSLYSPIGDSMKSQGYWQWKVALNEHIVRAIVVRIASKYYGDEFAFKNFYRPEFGKRYIYLDLIIAKLQYYESNRNRYPSFKSFANELLDGWDSIDEDEIVRLQKKVDDIRFPRISSIPKPYNFSNDSTTYFIVGTQESDKVAQESMHKFVREYKDRISTKSKIITDVEALEMDLSKNDVFVFGTPEGNVFLKKYIKNIPIIISKNEVITNKVLLGDNFQIVTSWVNPFNSKKAMIIYTAQKTENIHSYHFSPVKDKYHYWIANNTITIDKGDYVDFWNVWTCDLLTN